METLKDELLNLAFQLAYFIHQDKELAKRIALAALEKVETAALAQDKRLYYPGRRSKVSMTELHLLQRLVYGESEDYERQRESNAVTPPSEETMLIHFIKHLVRITVRRNSLYVTLGLSRLLHQYSTVEAQELYNLVVQDPNRVPSEDYCRSRKKNLMEDLKKRFGQLLTTARGARGEERFAAHGQPERFVELVRACLAAFTPWHTACCVPDCFAPTSDALAALVFGGGDPDAEHDIEVNRFHAVLHPDCFTKLIRGLGYGTPAERLEVPRFALTRDADEEQDQPPATPPNPPSVNLDESERTAMHDQLKAKAGRRKKLATGLLHFVVDGAEVARLDLRRATQTSFTLPEDAEFLEVRARDNAGDVVLATHALVYGDDDLPRAQQTALVLEGGQQLAFQISPTRDHFGSATGAAATVNYRETRPLRALRLWWLRQSIGAAPGVIAPLRWLLPLSAILLVTTATLATFWQRERQANQRIVAQLAQAQAEQQRLDGLLKQAQLDAMHASAKLSDVQAQRDQLLQSQTAAPAPAIVPSIFLWLREERGAEAEETHNLPKQATAFRLSLERSAPLEYTTYVVELLDVNKQPLQRRSGIHPRRYNNYRLNVRFNCAELSDGQYWLRLTGQRDNTAVSLGDYPIKLNFQ